MTLSKNEISERIDEGSIHCLVTLEVAGRPKEHVTESLNTFLDLLDKEEAITTIKTDTHDAKELEDNEGYFSAFSEVEMLVPQAESLVSLAINLTPASIEILAPDEFRFPALDMQNWVNDVLAHAHTIGQALRSEKQKNTYLNKNMLNLAQNMITVLLARQPMNLEEIKKFTGMEQEPLKKIIKTIEEKEQIKEVDGKWQLA